MANLASRIKQLRLEKELTQTELANILGVLRSAVSNWEKGLRVPKTDTICKMCLYFGVTADYIYGNTNGRNSVIAPPTFTMDINKLNHEGQMLLLNFYKFLLSDDKYKNPMNN